MNKPKQKLLKYTPTQLNDLLYTTIQDFLEVSFDSELVVREDIKPSHRVRFRGKTYSIKTIIWFLCREEYVKSHIRSYSENPRSVDIRFLYVLHPEQNKINSPF